MQILVRNLDRKLSQPELLALFQKYGKVKSCDLVTDAATGLSKGFGFVDMPDLSEATKAIENLNGSKVGGMAMRVKRAAHSTTEKHRPKPKNE
jgi:RNA recognition motif-containing protein